MSTPIVLDTNVVLDLLVFDDPATPALQQALDEGALRWIATPVMREELARVLEYPHLVVRLDHYRLSADDVLAAFDRQVQRVDVAPRAPMVCRDPDDQKFIDLAVAHRAALLSKDHAVLKLRKRLTLQGVPVATRLDALPVLEPVT
ncbi:MAG: putative toxin-antitoxin system toxin component, PIN family [Burkholderiaceae bacterium]|jgi:putative PIN family toxin of toxin-antitoxin system|nr:putative toxin-antitoxin system toxin component, PIN family [Burkholderiaceae bacterium]